jgi:hypothetical protein
VQSRKHSPELREMQLNPDGQSALLAQDGVQTPSGKLPPVTHRASAQSASDAHGSPVAAFSSPQAATAATTPNITTIDQDHRYRAMHMVRV